MNARVLVVGRHEVLMDRIVGILQRHGFDTVPALDDEGALSALAAGVDVILLGGGVEPASRARLMEAAERRTPAVPVVEHFGGFHNLAQKVAQALPG